MNFVWIGRLEKQKSGEFSVKFQKQIPKSKQQNKTKHTKNKNKKHKKNRRMGINFLIIS